MANQVVPDASGTTQGVLTAAPLDVVSLVWHQLSAADRGSLRLSCPQLRSLTNLVITSATHDLSPLHDDVLAEDLPKPRRSDYSDDDGDDESEAGVEDSDDDEHGAGNPAWRHATACRSAFLANLPRLQSLQIQHCVNKADFLHAMQHYTPSLTSHLTSLTLHGCGLISGAATLAISKASLSLQALTINTDNKQAAKNDKAALRGDVFAPFRDSALTQLTISVHRRVSGNVLRSLAGLSRLRRLDLTVWSLHLHQLPLLARLSRLTHLSFSHHGGCDRDNLVRLSSLFLITQLLSLRLPSASTPYFNGGGGAPPPQLAAAMALLGGMTRLQALELGGSVTINDTIFSAVKQLTQLTRLSAYRIQLSEAAPGHLPLLQELVVSRLQPGALLQTLLPLLPLPSLKALPSEKMFFDSSPTTSPSRLCVGPATCGDDRPPEEHAAALLQVAQHLAAAPHLQLSDAELGFGTIGCGGRHPPVPLRRMLDSVGPLAHRLHHLALRELKEAVPDWGLLVAGLPAMVRLTLHECELTEATLTALVSTLPSRTCLRLLHCGSLHGMRRNGGWERLVAACPRPLVLLVEPADPGAPPDLLAHAGAGQ